MQSQSPHTGSPLPTGEGQGEGANGAGAAPASSPANPQSLAPSPASPEASGESAGEQALEHYGGRLRVRVAALIPDGDRQRLLLAEHEALWRDDDRGDAPFWTPPGGGVEFGEPLAEALRREVREETGLEVEVGALRYVLDFVRPPLHAVSFYFECALAPEAADRRASGEPVLGSDPELETQLLRDLAWIPLDDLADLHLYPAPFRQRLASDLRAGFPEGLVYLGTFR